MIATVLKMGTSLWNVLQSTAMPTRRQKEESNIRQIFCSSSDEEDSPAVSERLIDLPGESEITLDPLGEGTMAPVAASSVGTKETEAGGATTNATTSDVNSVNSLPDAQAQNSINFSVMGEEADIDKTTLFSQMNDTFARDTHDALEHRPVNKKRTRQSSTEDSEGPSLTCLLREKKLKLTKAKTSSVLEIPINNPIVGDVVMEEGLAESSTKKDDGETMEEEESECQEFSHSVRTCSHQFGWSNCRVSIHPIQSPSWQWYNPWINPAWLHSEINKLLKTQVEKEKQRALEYSEKNLEAAEVIMDLKENLKDQADTIAEMKGLNEDQKENLEKKEETISEMGDHILDLRENRDGLALKMEEDKEKHNEELNLLKEKQSEELKLLKHQMEEDQKKHNEELNLMEEKQNEELKQLKHEMEEDQEKHNGELKQLKHQMEHNQEKHTKELQDMSVKVGTFMKILHD